MRRARGMQHREHVRAQLLRRDQHAPHVVALGERRELFATTQHGHAVDPLAALVRVVVQEAERRDPKRRIVEQLTDRELARVARTVDRHRLAAPRESPAHLLERAERHAGRQHERGREQRVDPEHAGGGERRHAPHRIAEQHQRAGSDQHCLGRGRQRTHRGSPRQAGCDPGHHGGPGSRWTEDPAAREGNPRQHRLPAARATARCR